MISLSKLFLTFNNNF
ncbi:hypothetical protein AB8J26_000729 [Clostridium perfringens]|nr:hypothetical protein [Clostridium perfringens]ELC8346911.1 hypothetical protein [Clostridium perfringens]ELC8438817.1 hypothetical protein [Clostridium perfringens]HEE9844956.1 hypothetical protein [Clostridium perfringens]